MVTKSQLKELESEIEHPLTQVRKGIVYPEADLRLSIQANEHTYCTPRVSGLPIEDYSAVEIAIVISENFISPATLVQEYGVNDEILELSEHFEDGESPVGAYIPIEKVYRLKKALDRKFIGCRKSKSI